MRNIFLSTLLIILLAACTVFGMPAALAAEDDGVKVDGNIESSQNYTINQQFVEDLVAQSELQDTYELLEKYSFSRDDLVKIKEHIKFLLNNEPLFRKEIDSQAARSRITRMYMVIQEILGELFYGKILNVRFIKQSGCYDYFITAAEYPDENPDDLCGNDSRIDTYLIVELADGSRESFYLRYCYMIKDRSLKFSTVTSDSHLTLYFVALKDFDAFYDYSGEPSDNGPWVLVKVWKTENVK